MEYFNTYGGCTAAGAAGSAVLHILQEESLQQHAQRVGEHLIAKLDALKQVGDEDWLSNWSISQDGLSVVQSPRPRQHAQHMGKRNP